MTDLSYLLCEEFAVEHYPIYFSKRVNADNINLGEENIKCVDVGLENVLKLTEFLRKKDEINLFCEEFAVEHYPIYSSSKIRIDNVGLVDKSMKHSTTSFEDMFEISDYLRGFMKKCFREKLIIEHYSKKLTKYFNMDEFSMVDKVSKNCLLFLENWFEVNDVSKRVFSKYLFDTLVWKSYCKRNNVFNMIEKVFLFDKKWEMHIYFLSDFINLVSVLGLRTKVAKRTVESINLKDEVM